MTEKKGYQMRRLLVTALLAVAGFTGLLMIAPANATPPPASMFHAQLTSSISRTAPALRLHVWPEPDATANTPNPGTLGWHVLCVHKYGFCADFPYVIGSTGNFEHHTDYTSATSVTGHLVNYTSNVWVADSGHGYCLGSFTKGCNPEGRHDQFYFVEIIHSKYTDHWQALSAINGGVYHPVFIRVHGHLTCTFRQGIYGGPGLTVWAHGNVYYLESANLALKANPHSIVERFLHSIRFIKVSR